MGYPRFVLRLPDWLEALAVEREGRLYPNVEDRMRLVVELSRLNVEHETGGPFGAAVFDLRTGRLMAAGVNMVTWTNCSVAHAEIVALVLAQQRIGHYDLGFEGMPPYELVSSTEPCAMCLGAIPWSGVRSVVCGARDEDARQIGFDEGPKTPRWIESLEERGIRVTRDVRREQARSVLRLYWEKEGVIYNARQGALPDARYAS